MARKLKVYRTPIGFHDAYVAASSQKAALEAWGADVDLFARGAAEIVTDDALTQEPLKQPGKIVRRLRGSSDEHLAALAGQDSRQPKKAQSRRGEDPKSSASPASAHKKKPEPRPRPSRSKLTAAEEVLDRLATSQTAEREALREHELALQRERRALEERQESETAKAEEALKKQRLVYEEALEKWRG